jgi:hypothetical protein
MVRVNGSHQPRPPEGSPDRQERLDSAHLAVVEGFVPRPAAEADLAEARRRLAAAERAAREARERADRADVVAESTAAGAATAREMAREAISAAEKAEAETIEARRVARQYSAEAEAAGAESAAAREALAGLEAAARDAARAEAAARDAAARAEAEAEAQAEAARRVRPWIEYPKPKSPAPAPEVREPRPATARRLDPIQVPLEAAERPRTPVRKRLVVPKGYEIIRRLADDEMGVTCLARQVGMDRLVQLKLLHEDKSGDREFVERFLREARTAGKFNHPNLIRVHAAGRAGAQYYYSIEHVEGQSLHAAVRGGSRFETRRALRVARDLASGLQEWEKHGMVHGGLGPARVVAAGSGDFKLLGLGLALRGVDLLAELEPAELSYVAPELVLGDSVDSRADCYSLGAVLFFMLTGQVPHAADNPGDVIRSARESPGPLMAAMRGLPRQLVAVVTRATQADPAARYEMISELIEAIDRAISGSRVAAAVSDRARAASRRRRH